MLDTDRGASTSPARRTRRDAGPTWPRAAKQEGRLAELARRATFFTRRRPTFPFGAHVAVVEVDTETGKVGSLRLVACRRRREAPQPADRRGPAATAASPTGVAQALFEEFAYDDDGNPITSNFADYAFISAAELPSFELVTMETPTPVNPLGAKGIGESGTIGSTPAVQSAVIDALSPFGVRHVDMPANGERVYRRALTGRARVRLDRRALDTSLTGDEVIRAHPG